MPLRSVTARDPIWAYFGDDYGGAPDGIAVEPGHGAPTFFGGGRRRRDRWPGRSHRAPAAGWDVRVTSRPGCAPRSGRASSSPPTARGSCAGSACSRRSSGWRCGRRRSSSADGTTAGCCRRPRSGTPSSARTAPRTCTPTGPTWWPCWRRRSRPNASRWGGGASAWSTTTGPQDPFRGRLLGGRRPGGRGGRHPLRRAPGALRRRAADVHRARGLPRLVPAERVPSLDRRCTVRLGRARTSCTTSSPRAATSTSSPSRRRARGRVSRGPTAATWPSSGPPSRAGTRSSGRSWGRCARR
jgi:hypothetical protein